MFKVTIQVRYRSAAKDQALDGLWSLSAAYHQSGQLVSGSLVSKHRGGLTLTGVAQERSSLSPRNDSSMARDARKGLRRHLRTEPAISFEPLVEAPRTCGCSLVREVLFDPQPHPLVRTSPLRCRSCRGFVPLYRFGHECLQLLSAETIWRGLQWAWMDSAEAEALGWNQISDPDSDLSRLIRRRLRTFARRHRIRAYYHLASQYWTEKGIERTLCPGCGRPWSTDFQERLTCRRCSLTTGVSSDGQVPDWWRPLPRHRR